MKLVQMTSILFLTLSIAHKYFLSDYFFCLLNSLRDMQTIAAASIPSVGPAPQSASTQPPPFTSGNGEEENK